MSTAVKPTAAQLRAEAAANRQAAAEARAAAARLAAPAGQNPGNVLGNFGDQPNPGLLPAEPRNAAIEGQWGLKSYGHFLSEVRDYKVKGESGAPTIMKAYKSDAILKAATGMGELIGSDGGFLVPPTFSKNIFERVYTENNLLSRTDQYTCAGNSMVFPRNAESSRANGSRWGGVRAYWVQEGSTITLSAPTFGRLTLNLHKLACTAAVTEELLADASGSGMAMEAYLNKVFSSEIAFAINAAIVRGTGSGQPLGLINAPCAVTVSKETGQDAATITSANIVKMWQRRFALGPTGQYVWLVNQDIGSQLHLLTLGIGTAGVVTYMPPGGLSSKPYATLMGAPVIETEWNSTLGTVGDIILVDLSQYVTINKGVGSVNTLSSMHVYFLSDQQAFKTTWRTDGSMWQADALTPYQGTNTQSPVVLLATRS